VKLGSVVQVEVINYCFCLLDELVVKGIMPETSCLGKDLIFSLKEAANYTCKQLFQTGTN
jgi:hypothetical protein